MHIKRSIVFAILFIGNAYSQQRLGELQLSPVDTLTTIVRSETQTVLTVLSEVPNLVFESTRQILEVQQIDIGEWRLFLAPGRQIITIRATGYLPQKTETINLRVKTAYQIKVTIARPAPGRLRLISTPDSATIRINGILVDEKTPYVNEEIQPGDYNIQISKAGFRTTANMLKVQSNEMAEWHANLVQTAVRVVINIENQLSDVGIVVDGQIMGIAPNPIYLEPGAHTLMLQKAGYKYIEKVMEIQLNEREFVLTEKLKKIKPSLLSRWWFWTSTAAAIAGGVFLLPKSSSDTPASPLPIPPEFPPDGN